MPYDPNQPRVPAGNENGGEWTYDPVYNAIRKGAGLPAQNKLPTPNAMGGITRVVGGVKINTADIVNKSLISAESEYLDADILAVKNNLPKNPTFDQEKYEKITMIYGEEYANAAYGIKSDAEIAKLAKQRLILRHIDKNLSNANVTAQFGNNYWNFESAESIMNSLNKYLDRRLSGQHARWTERKKGY